MRKLISSIIALAMAAAMLPMTMANAEDLTVSEVVSIGKTAYAYVDGTLSSASAKLTDGSTDGVIDWVNSGSDKPVIIDLEASYAISKVVVDRSSGYGAATAQFELYASDTLYETITNVKANATLIGTNESTEKGIDVTFTPDTAVQGQYVYLVPTTAQSLLEITVYANTVIPNVVEQVVSVGKPVTAYTDGTANGSSAKLTDGSTSTYAYWVNSGGDKPVTIDLGGTCYITKVVVNRRTYGEANGAFGIYASDNSYTTNASVKAGAALVGTNEATGSPITITPESAVAGRYVYLTPDTAQGLSEITVYAKVPQVEVTTDLEVGFTGKLDITNVKNVLLGGDDSRTYGEYVTLTFPAGTDMSTVTASDIVVSDESAVLSNVTPIIDADAKTAKIPVYQLSGRQDITVSFGLFDTAEQANVTGASITFYAGEVAPLAPVEGKVIKNVAQYKEAYTNDGQWRTGESWGKASNITDAYAGSCRWDYNKNFIIIDLGNEYEISAMGMIEGAHGHSNSLQVYVTPDGAPADITALSALTPTWTGRTSTTDKYFNSTKFDTPMTTRYICVGNGAWEVACKELMAYSYVDASDADIYFDHNTVTDADTETEGTQIKDIAVYGESYTGALIIAEYDATGTLVGKAFAPATKSTTGLTKRYKASLPYVEGHTYRAFAWDSISGMKPVADDILN